jgi:hypothetical protein
MSKLQGYEPPEATVLPVRFTARATTAAPPAR